MLLLVPLGVLLIYLGFRAWGQPLDKDRVAYWQTTVQGLDEEPDVFFSQVYQALKEGLATRDVQLSGMGFGPTKLFETHLVFSQRPLYLQAKYKHLSYYLFLGQTPTGLFLSSRVYNKYVKGEGQNAILSYPALKSFQRQTMFQYDATLMFLESAHAIVLQVLDSYIKEKKLKPLEEYERRPILHSFYANAYPPRPQQVWTVPVVVSATESIRQGPSAQLASGTPTLTTVSAAKVLPLEEEGAFDTRHTQEPGHTGEDNALEHYHGAPPFAHGHEDDRVVEEPLASATEVPSGDGYAVPVTVTGSQLANDNHKESDNSSPVALIRDDQVGTTHEQLENIDAAVMPQPSSRKGQGGRILPL